jgi:chromosome partitioning protein
MKNAKIIALINQKGGVGKTVTSISLGTGLARQGKKVLCADLDPQANMTMSLGYQNPDELPRNIFHVLKALIERKPFPERQEYILQAEGVDLLPSGIELSSLETVLISTMNRESKLKQLLAPLREEYEYIIIDCGPSLDMLTINALAAADEIIIPVQAHYLSAKGLELLLNTVRNVKSELNPALKINGILITMLDRRSRFAKEIVEVIKATYGPYIRIYESQIPMSVKATETTAEGKSIFEYDPSNKAAIAYEEFVAEVLARER